MRGKYVNLSMGIMNILFGILIIVFQIYVPQDISDLTVQENQVTNVISISIKILLIIISIINFIAFYNNKMESGFKSGYKITLFSLSYFILPKFIIAIFPIIGGIIIIKKIMKENLIELDSTLALSVILLIFVAIFVLIVSSFLYTYIGQYMYKKQNKDEMSYSDTFFKYITELDTQDVYIGFKVNGKYGYINQKGEIVIDFEYDFASPFIKINMYNKNFDIALVCKDGKSYIIMKNKRIVKSYVSESSNDDYEAKIKELEDFYKNTLKQTGDMQYEIEPIKSNMNKAKVYDEKSTEYTYKYDYNSEYDIIVIQSNMGLKDTYYLVKKDDEKNKIQLECDNLSYDENFLYLYSNGDLPFYSVSTREQGWFNSYGKKTNMKGKAQILEIVDKTLLIRNYNDKTIYFINEYEEIVSSIYKDIFIGIDERYIIRNTNGKFVLINKEYQQVIDEEFDFVDTSLARYGLYVCGNFPEKINVNNFGYAKLNLKIIDSNGGILIDNVEQVYGTYYKVSKDIKDKEKQIEDLKSRMQKLDYEFIGDKFYDKYR
ncbi:MAG: WG repeat-containing protein [Candidatus Scatovivens sp.]